MKFSCERCGKKYATAETPAPGRVYKIKCKACGHLIVVKASAAANLTATTELRAPTSIGLPAVQPAVTPPPGLTLEVAAPEPALSAGGPALDELPPEPPDPVFPGEFPAVPANGAPASHPQATQEISVAALQAALAPAAEALTTMSWPQALHLIL